MRLADLRRKASTAALVAFRRLPGPLRRNLVRAGTPNYTVGAVCLLEHEGEVLFLWQPHRSGWSLPGGLLDRNESPAEAVVREVFEETGLRIEPGDPVVVEVHPATQAVDVVFRVLAADRPDIRVSHEARKWHWWRLQELTDADQETRQILGAVQRAGRGPRTGTLLVDGPDDGVGAAAGP